MIAHDQMGLCSPTSCSGWGIPVDVILAKGKGYGKSDRRGRLGYLQSQYYNVEFVSRLFFF